MSRPNALRRSRYLELALAAREYMRAHGKEGGLTIKELRSLNARQFTESMLLKYGLFIKVDDLYLPNHIHLPPRPPLLQGEGSAEVLLTLLRKHRGLRVSWIIKELS